MLPRFSNTSDPWTRHRALTDHSKNTPDAPPLQRNCHQSPSTIPMWHRRYATCKLQGCFDSLYQALRIDAMYTYTHSLVLRYCCRGNNISTLAYGTLLMLCCVAQDKQRKATSGTPRRVLATYLAYYSTRIHCSKPYKCRSGMTNRSYVVIPDSTGCCDRVQTLILGSMCQGRKGILGGHEPLRCASICGNVTRSLASARNVADPSGPTGQLRLFNAAQSGGYPIKLKNGERYNETDRPGRLLSITHMTTRRRPVVLWVQ